MTFGEKLTNLRKQKGMSQDDLANIIGVSRQSISKWELGECEPSIVSIRKIAEIFKVSIDYLLSDIINDDIVSEVSTADNIHQPTVNQNIVIANFNYWFIFIIMGFVGLIICLFIPYIFGHISCTLRTGYISYLIDWCGGAIAWKIGLILSIAMLILGFIKTFYKPNKNIDNGKAKKPKSIKRKNIIIIIISAAVVLIALIAMLIVFMYTTKDTIPIQNDEQVIPIHYELSGKLFT